MCSAKIKTIAVAALSPAGFWLGGNPFVVSAVLFVMFLTGDLVSNLLLKTGESLTGKGKRMGSIVRSVTASTSLFVAGVATNWYAALPG